MASRARLERPGDDQEAALRATQEEADLALYHEKETGRRRLPVRGLRAA